MLLLLQPETCKLALRPIADRMTTPARMSVAYTRSEDVKERDRLHYSFMEPLEANQAEGSQGKLMALPCGRGTESMC
jgi:hypothetical protein